MKIIFMGTPDFAVPTLEQIIAAGHEVTLVVTQPDKPKGRGKAMQYTPVKECAVAHEIPVFQPVKIREAECIETLRQYEADIMVVVAFGQILPKEILDMPKYGCINVHASLLPKYRGAAPIQWVILDGEERSGVTIMQMDVGLDTGDMLSKVEIELDENETGGSLHDKLAEAGAKLCVDTLVEIEKETVTPVPQTDENTCYAKMLTKQLGNIDWNRPAVEIERLIRGLNPWPSAYTFYQGKMLKIWSAKVIAQQTAEAEAGSILKAEKDRIFIQTGEGILQLTELQPEGKKRMAADAFLRGYQLEIGAVLKNER